jgi:P27 family predicted phage terminase small subunit
MKSGKKPESLEVKIRKGTVSKKVAPLLPALATLENGIPNPPLAFSRELVIEWEKVWDAVKNYASPIGDYELVVGLCLLRVEASEMRAIIKEEGLMSSGYKGQPRPHPLLASLRTLEKAILAREDRLSLNPIDRSRLGIVEVKKISKLDELRARREAGIQSYTASVDRSPPPL